MANQMLKRINVEKYELEWLYVPDTEYCEYDGYKRYLQLIIPYRRQWKEDKKYPIIFFIPGAQWRRQEMYNGLLAHSRLAKRGFAIAEVQVRESDIAKFPAQIIDVKRAIRFIHSIAEQYHLDTDNIFISGDSAGGHMALLTGLTAESGELDYEEEHKIPIQVNGMIAYCAPTDMFLSRGTGSMEALIGTDKMENAPERARSASCGTYLSKEQNIPPILMFHGAVDSQVTIEHSRSFFEKLKQYDKEVEYYELENEDHNPPTFWENDILDIVEEFAKRHCK